MHFSNSPAHSSQVSRHSTLLQSKGVARMIYYQVWHTWLSLHNIAKSSQPVTASNIMRSISGVVHTAGKICLYLAVVCGVSAFKTS